MASKQLSVIQAFMKSLDNTTKSGTKALDEAITACSSFKGIQDAIDHMVEDCNNASSAEAFLKNYCGINLSNTDTGAITGSDAGGSKVKNYSSVVPESGSIKTFTGTSFSKNGLKVNVPLASSDDEQRIINGLYTWWIEKALDLIEESYSYSFNDSDATVKEITFYFADSLPNDWTAQTKPYYNNNKCSRLEITLSMRYWGGLLDNYDGKSSYASKFYLDRTLAHELTHALMMAKVNYEYDLPLFVCEGLAELTQGADDRRSEDLLALAKNSSLIKQALVFSSSGATVTGLKSPSYSGGYLFLRYLAKQASTNYPPKTNSKSITGTEGADDFNNTISGATISALGGNDWIYNTGSKTKIVAGAGNDSIFNHVANVTIDGGAGADYIYNSSVASGVSITVGDGNDSIFNHGSNVTISGGKGNDYISNYAGKTKISMVGGAGNDSIFNNTGINVTISGDAGNDYINLGSDNSRVVMKYSKGDGNDTVYGYNNTDTIYISGEKYSTVNSGEDINIKVGSNTIYLKYAKGKKLNIKGTYMDLSKDSTVAVITNADSAVITVGSAIKTINAYSRTKAVFISANDNANTIIGGSGSNTIWGAGGNDWIGGGNGKDEIYGGAGNDTIIGNSGNDYISANEGNDYISGGSGNDTIWGGAGNDTIYGGEGNDTLFGGSGKDVFNYYSGDGNDVIADFTNNVDILNIIGSYTSSTKGNDVVFKVGSGSVTLKNVLNL